MAHQYTDEQRQQTYDRNKDRVGQTMINIHGNEIENSVLLSIDPQGYTYWCNDRLVDLSCLEDRPTHLYLSREQINLLVNGLK